ncbi:MULTISPECIES: TIM44-like domain-containing protein [Bosea]|uniref:Tim44 domain-containing protein n=1 Tax=Bosea TaxID=85413 RepID=UPI0021505426|nr:MULTISPECIES: TIM44-like domain-containing protein [Bosea]MCR4524274.1 TIM44-like domain-containing protein [Bosea sp. 47.2.35]MDR6826376.1 putative lipid-binding transport protein (Tim44 family) [Bosea robiniae]MDR6893086.1 putative lipid-binding transport protein (Tim44 family) [Bosea sp. BE109]MDR7137215.1 putative lipid-binding transport protein (Tim44 family) [Bosea sp. BE168]MDR7173915.1 putative lipid-binding transport protein (Tim44 family) [Bosea sp. BE271]
MSLISLARRGRAVALVAGALLLVPLVAEARPGGGRSSGSRGSFTNSAPPSTNTTPGGAQTFQRSAPASPSMAGPAAAGAAAQAARPSFARNMMMGIGAGLLGAGLFGLLSGSGFFSGLASLAGMLGFVLQLALIAGIVVLAIRFFRRRSEPQLAGAGAPYARQGYDAPQPQPAAARMGGFGGGAAAAVVQPQPIELSGDDFNAFERLLGEINTAYSNEDEAGLRQRTTTEMFGYFDEDLSDNARRGVADRVSDVKLLQGDLSQAWREGDLDYATVAMRFSLINAAYDRKTGKIVDGSATQAQEVSEYWTFVRERGAAWKLSGIQQAA